MNAPSQNIPLVDPRTGLVHPQWYKFLTALGKALGTSSTPLQDALMRALYQPK